MSKSQDTAPTEAPSLFEIHSALIDECSALRLILNTLVDHQDIGPGEPAPKGLPEYLYAAVMQLRRVMGRIRHLSDRIDELDLHADLRPKVVVLPGGGGHERSATG
jgi:hypothetical protein